MPDFIFPSNAELQVVAQDKIPLLIADRPIFQVLPMVDVDAFVLAWEQKDNYVGLQQIRGINGTPGKVKAVGGKRYMVEPGVYGEFGQIDERELLARRQWGSFNAPIDISDLVMERQDQLLGRRLDRIEKIGWDLLTTGSYSVALGGATMISDTFSLQTFTAAVAWSTPATATPLGDFRSVKLLARGHSVSFGAGAKAYMNQVTANRMLANINSGDLFGRRTSGLGTFNNIGEVNTLLAGDDLPQIVVYDGGYQDDSNTFVPWLANGKVVVVGQRPAGQKLGDYAMVRNASNPSLAPGAAMKVIDHGERQEPRLIEVYDGHNGGPRIYFPSAIVIMNV